MKGASGLPTPFAYLAAVTLCFAGTGSQRTFHSPTDAVTSLVTSIENGDYALYLSTVGPEMNVAWATGDPARDAIDRERLLLSIGKVVLKQDRGTPDRMILYLGDRREPFPAPLVRQGKDWRFDGIAGSQEVVRRRILRNELAVAGLCRQYVDAQLDYSAVDHGLGDFAFAQRIRATPGRQDGLYWSGEGVDDQSPEGPLFAAAAYAELHPPEIPHPYFGYYFKILLGPAPEAIGAALDNGVDRDLVRGFGLIAWPALYRVSGVNSFVVNHRGAIYQRDLGVETPRLAATMTTFNPDTNWIQVLPDFDGEEK